MYDVVVIGGGHAGCEASLASARMGQKTLLVTLNFNMVANMPCNPSIGGPAKGNVVKEIDALGGEMGRNINKTLIQIKMLNNSKGPAVRSLRAQADKVEYPKEMQKTILGQENLTVLEKSVKDLIVEDGKVVGVVVGDNEVIETKAVVITSGTYLQSKTLRGDDHKLEGPDGEKRSVSLSKSLSRLNVNLKRFKTGTPPRVTASSVDWSKTEIQPGDDKTWSFSYYDTKTTELNIPCYLTYTNELTHKIIRDNFDQAPMFTGTIKGVGPRYCPSIEDKVNRFADKERHQLFLEPESQSTDLIYVQGLSSSFSVEIQDEFLRTIPGLENAEVVRYAYAIEYDVIDPIQLNQTLEFKKIKNLFSAGQINGTSGYEEAAGQGLIAGINAALKSQDRELVVLSRTNSYIGTMIDDIVTKGVNDPYRLLTSRSEYRLILRNDNAHIRLGKIGYDAGLLSRKDYDFVLSQIDQITQCISLLNEKGIDSSEYVNNILKENGCQELKQGTKIINILKRPDINFKILNQIFDDFKIYDDEILEMVEIEVKYKGYIDKMYDHIKKSQKLEQIVLPENFDYRNIKSLSLEAIEKLNKIQPQTIYQATRVSGVTPSDISVLQINFTN